MTDDTPVADLDSTAVIQATEVIEAISASVSIVGLQPGELTETNTTFDSAMNICANVPVTMSDGRVFTSNGNGHVVVPSGMTYTVQSGYITERSR